MQLIGILQPTQAPQNYDTDNICYLVIIPIIFFCRFYFLEVLLYAFHVPILPLFLFEGKIDFRDVRIFPIANQEKCVILLNCIVVCIPL